MKRTLLTNATIVDGTGGPAYSASLLIEDDRIAATGVIDPSIEAETFDCSGLHIAPGFIDVHSHADMEVLARKPNKLLQGVTTEVIGNCGFSLYPTLPNMPKMTGEIFDGEPVEGMASAGHYFAALETAKPVLNVAALTGHSALRVYAMRMRSDLPSEEDFAVMEKALHASLQAGSLGFSTGLNCGAASFSNTDELVRLCGPVRRHGAYYTTHMRDYKFKVIQAVEESIEVGRRAGVPVQISHMQVVGQKNWHRLDAALELIESAHRSGLDIHMDAYPYLAGSCSLLQFLPKWCQDGGATGLLRELADPAKFDRIAKETEEGLANTWDDIIICGLKHLGARSLIGKSIQRVAEDRGLPPSTMAMTLIREQDGDVFIISFNNNEDNLRKVLTHPLNSVITDGFVLEGGLSHPRTFGTYPKFLGEYVRDKRWLPLEEAIVKTSAQAARRFQFHNRGLIAPGNFADLVVFDYSKIGTQADYSDPARDPEGIRHVIVNGCFGVRDGRLTGEAAGRPLRHQA